MDLGRELSSSDLKVLRNVLSDVVTSLDELIVLEEREAAGETVSESEAEMALGRFMMALLKADALK